MPRLRTVVINSVLVMVSVITALVAALALDGWLNLGLRYGMARLFEKGVQEPELVMYVFDNGTGWRLNPRTQYHRRFDRPFGGLAGLASYDTRLRINSDGFIDRDHYLETPYYRIAFLGDSWVEAVQVEYENRFTPLTEDYVHDRSEGKKVIEVMNFGVSNGSPAHSYGAIKTYMAKYKPDEAWIFVTAADIRANSPIDTSPPFGGTFVYGDAARTRLEDIKFGFVDPPAYVRAQRVKAQKEGLLAEPGFQSTMAHHYSTERHETYERVWKDMRMVMELIKKTLDSQGVRMRIVYIPPIYEVDAARWEQYRREVYKAVGREIPLEQALSEKRFSDLAKNVGAEFISLTPLCKEKGAAVMYGDHFSRMGHHWVADYLARVVLDTVDSPKARPH